MNMKQFQITILQLGMLETNCYIVSELHGRKSAVIDPADDHDYIVSVLTDLQLDAEKIILTHGHYDHIGALEPLARAISCPVLIHAEDASMLSDPAANFSAMLGNPSVYADTVHYLTDGERIMIGAAALTVIHTPGHTPGSISLAADDFVLSGDTLFQQGVGRTDLPGGSAADLAVSIQEKLFILPEDTMVFPGHGPPTTIKNEKRSNPFFA